MSGGLSVLTQQGRCYQCQLSPLHELGTRSVVRGKSVGNEGCGGGGSRRQRTSNLPRTRHSCRRTLGVRLSIAVGQTAKQGRVHGGKVVGS
jgi:hypothetical protein